MKRSEEGEGRGPADLSSAPWPVSPGVTARWTVAGWPTSRQDLPHSSLLSFFSDYVIDDKVAVLQKRDHEGFGFVLRGAKGNGEWVPARQAGRGCTLLGVVFSFLLLPPTLLYPALPPCLAPAPPYFWPQLSLLLCCGRTVMVCNVPAQAAIPSLRCFPLSLLESPTEWGPFWSGRRGFHRGSCRGSLDRLVPVLWLPVALPLLRVTAPCSRLFPVLSHSEVAVWQPPPPEPHW